MKFNTILTWMLLALSVGCASSYCWRSSVPEEYRTVSVPVFRNESNLNEIGAVSARQILREFQREGTFSIRRAGDSAIEIQGVVKKVNAGAVAYDRRSGLRYNTFTLTMETEVSVIDKRNSLVMVDNRKFSASTSFTGGQDIVTLERDASGRLADDLSRQVVDFVLGLNFSNSKEEDDRK